MTALIRYEAARAALQAAHSVDEVKDIRDKAQAMAAYARQAKDTALVEWATEIKVRAERRAGEMLRDMPKHTGGRPSKTTDIVSAVSTLADIGVTDKQSERWQKLAAVPEDKFEQAVAAAKEVAGEVTTAALLRLNHPHVSHNSGENEWYTPPNIIERARATMGVIDCDPASSAVANGLVMATTFYTAEQDGLAQTWFGRVWMNPPYSNPLCSQFCAALTRKFEAGEIEQACVLVNNATETGWFQAMLRVAASACFLEGRVRYLNAGGEPVGAPLQGQAILYFGKRQKQFSLNFTEVGIVLMHV